ncbi:protein FAM184A [Rhipicephalus sanguineus]|uniref:protein FAM184A n=1 Tax=Rhipicephalus sanguineus TaxID=34632 RepID=UPI0020C2CCB8|nr:protein FAM184A [Rhipicephalus sanguineus]
MPADCFSPELFTKMAKKIAQLTKVVYTLNNRAEDQEALMLAMKQLHEEDVKRVTRDANDKMARYQNQVSRQVALLEGALVRERLERCRLEGELGRRRQQLEPAGQLVSLCAEIHDASVVLRSKLDAFDRLQLHVALALEGLPASAGLPGMTSSVIVRGQVENDCVLRKNDFLRDHCDKLAEENQRMRINFEGDLAQLRSFYEEKLHSSRRLQLANDASLHASRVDALLLELAHSEQQLDSYCKEARALSDELEKRNKYLKMMDDQASGSQQVLLQLTGRLKQSEAALNQLKASCALYKRDTIVKRGTIASLEATSREQQSHIEHLEAEALQVTPLLLQCDAQRRKLADTQEALTKLQEDTKKELLAKQQKLEDLERRLNSCRDESKCLKLIQAQLKESLSEAEHKIYVLNREVDQKAQALSKKEQEISYLQISTKKVKWELTEALQEKEAKLTDSRKVLERTFRKMNAAWERKIK